MKRVVEGMERWKEVKEDQWLGGCFGKKTPCSHNHQKRSQRLEKMFLIGVEIFLEKKKVSKSEWRRGKGIR